VVTPPLTAARLSLRVLGERAVDAHVRVRVDDAGEAQLPARVVHFDGLVDRDVRRHADEPPVSHVEVEALDLGLARSDHPHVLDEHLERTVGHGRAGDLLGVVEDDAERVARAAPHATHAVAHRRAIPAARALDGAVARREDDDLSLGGGDRLAP
jgi:hypothetical protein